MRYEKSGDLIQVTFTRAEYDEFLFLWGTAIGFIKTDISMIRVEGDDKNATVENFDLRYELLKFVDKMNENNPDWLPYTKGKKEDAKDKKTS